MRPLQYHEGQIAVQEEANSRSLADHMAQWVGPAVEFAERADLILLADLDELGTLRFTSVSGAAPLVGGAGSTSVRFSAGIEGLRSGAVGGLAINLHEQRRVRLNGVLTHGEKGDVLKIDEAFTLCRKYLAPSVAVDTPAFVGPRERVAVELGDPWLLKVVAGAETSFLASASPDGAPDVAHRGGPAGFLELDPVRKTLSWPEYLGDGVFKSAGNVRATSTLTLLVPDLDTGDAVELAGEGKYQNLRIMRGPRRDPLVRDRGEFPIQGRMEVSLRHATRLLGFMAPRTRAEGLLRVTSRSAVDDQAPQ